MLKSVRANSESQVPCVTSVRDRTVSGEGGEWGMEFSSLTERRFTPVWCAGSECVSPDTLESPDPSNFAQIHDFRLRLNPNLRFVRNPESQVPLFKEF